ncbi:uncharacterized protein BJX67DRAFT_351228 [Aspergillus lucknowensis]|uniref:Uncharacterized protein n=1 Tax=Aspergillus lucknowensis TaxID=176173 RepID=A0ABR4LUH1_9EURO
MSKPSPRESELQLLPLQTNTFESETGASPVPGFAQQHWPHQPQRLRSTARTDKFTTAFEVVLACLPIGFLAIAGLVIRLDGREISDYGQGIVQVTHLGPSVFPIIFAAIVGSMMRSIALWKAEKSAPLGLLEQLNGSTSFAGTVASIWSLRRPDLFTIPILLLWAMSPLGGQSALRLISQEPSTVSSNISVAYMSMNGSSGLEGQSSVADTFSPITSIYTTSLVASEEAKRSPYDAWGWPKIPLLRTLPLNDSGGTNPWRTPRPDGPVTYSSLVGLVVQGVPSGEVVEFPVESSYFDLDCHPLLYNVSSEEAVKAMGDTMIKNNASALFRDTAYLGTDFTEAYSNYFVDTSYNFTSPSRTQSYINLFYGSRDIPNKLEITVALFNCTMSTIHSESLVKCQNDSCWVTRMRQSEKDRRDDSITPFNDPNVNSWTALYNFIKQFPYAAGAVEAFQASSTDGYIYDDPLLFNPRYDRDWRNVSAEDISRRLTAVVNTYWQASLAPFTMSSASLLDPVNLTQAASFPPFNETTGTASRNVAVYRTNRAWATVFIVSTIILQLSALASLFLRSITIAPDILGYVSSLTRDSPHIPLPAGGSRLSGLERARLLRDLPVQISDVDERKDVGHIALVSRAGRGVGGRKLGGRRQYD